MMQLGPWRTHYMHQGSYVVTDLFFPLSNLSLSYGDWPLMFVFHIEAQDFYPYKYLGIDWQLELQVQQKQSHLMVLVPIDAWSML